MMEIKQKINWIYLTGKNRYSDSYSDVELKKPQPIFVFKN